MSYPRKLSLEGQQEIEQTALTRDRLLSDKELARKYRISINRVQQIMIAVRAKLRVSVCCKASNSGEMGAGGSTP